MIVFFGALETLSVLSKPMDPEDCCLDVVLVCRICLMYIPWGKSLSLSLSTNGWAETWESNIF